MKVVIIGGTGHVGTFLVPRLAFLSADPADLGIPAAMFRLGAEVWLTPSRVARS